jgi:hypothetical protein
MVLVGDAHVFSCLCLDFFSVTFFFDNVEHFIFLVPDFACVICNNIITNISKQPIFPMCNTLC